MRRPCKLAMLALTGLVVGAAIGGSSHVSFAAGAPQEGPGALPAVAPAPPREEPRLLPVLEPAPAGTVVFDDDGGRVQVVPRREVPAGEVSYHGGPVVTGGTIQAIFLGSGWRHEALRRREVETVNALLGHGAPAGEGIAALGAELAPFGLAARELAAPEQEDLLDPWTARASPISRSRSGSTASRAAAHMARRSPAPCTWCFSRRVCGRSSA